MILGDAEISEEKLQAVSDCEETFLLTGCGEDAGLFAFALVIENVEGLVGSFDGEVNCMDLKQDLKALGIGVDTLKAR